MVYPVSGQNQYKKKYKRTIKVIVKIQIPVSYCLSGDKVPEALIYNEDRSVQLMVPVDKVTGIFKDDEYKIFCNATINDKNKLVIGTRAPEQDW